MKAKQLPSGNWRVRVSKTRNGKKTVMSFTAPTKKEAELKALLYDGHQPCDATVRDAVTEYIEIYEPVLSPSTIAGYEKIKRNYFLDIYDIKIKDLTDTDIQNSINLMAKKGLSYKTIICAWTLVNCAIKRKNKDFRPDIKFPPKKKVVYATPDIDHLKKIFDCVAGTDIELPILFAGMMGMRMSEILGVSYGDVQGHKLYIHTAAVLDKNRNLIEKSTKNTSSTRIVDIPDKVYALIGKGAKNEKIVTMTASAINKKMQRILKNNDIPHCRFHDLRHANASLMLLLGVPDKYAMERGGWSSLSTIKKIYQQTFSSEQDKVSKTMNDFFNGM